MNAPSSPPSAPSFEEIRRILRELPGPDLEAQTAVVRRQAELTKPPGSLGRLEELAEWLAAWQSRAQPRIERPRIAVFAGTHGAALAHKIAVIDEALARHREAIAARDPLTLLAAVGGEEIAAIAGAIVAARRGRIPVLLDGYACTAAAAVLFAADRRATDHCK